MPSDVKPLLATALGDLFVVEGSGAVAFLDIIVGSYQRVADSTRAWEELLREPEFLNNHFAPGFVCELRESGVILAQGECYVPKHEPILGGSRELENWSPDRWVWHLERQGRVHFAIKDLPDGAQITSWNYTKL